MVWILFLLFLCIISFMAGWTTLGWILVAVFVIFGIILASAIKDGNKKEKERKRKQEERKIQRQAEIERKTPI